MEEEALQNGNPDTWARETWRSLLDMATRAVDNLTTRVQPVQPAQPAPETWWSRLDAKQVALLVVGGLLAVLLVKKLMD